MSVLMLRNGLLTVGFGALGQLTGHSDGRRPHSPGLTPYRTKVRGLREKDMPHHLPGGGGFRS